MGGVGLACPHAGQSGWNSRRGKDVGGWPASPPPNRVGRAYWGQGWPGGGAADSWPATPALDQGLGSTNQRWGWPEGGAVRR